MIFNFVAQQTEVLDEAQMKGAKNELIFKGWEKKNDFEKYRGNDFNISFYSQTSICFLNINASFHSSKQDFEKESINSWFIHIGSEWILKNDLHVM